MPRRAASKRAARRVLQVASLKPPHVHFLLLQERIHVLPDFAAPTTFLTRPRFGLSISTLFSMKHFFLFAALIVSTAARAHDSWVETNTNIVRVGDAVRIDVLLGNHGNAHRDFRIAGKVALPDSKISVIAPGGAVSDLKPQLHDAGLGENEGFWTTQFIAPRAGLYCVAQSSDAVMSYAPVRAIKSAKTFFLASKSLDKVAMFPTGFNRVLGHPLELVPQNSTVAPMGVGTPLRVRLLWKGKPLTNAVVSFVPRGAQLKDTFDARYERRTNQKGDALFEPNSANTYLVVAHHEDVAAKGKGFDSTKYSATLSVFVPQICACCGG
jgi:uncharacterized GH25 family protein